MALDVALHFSKLDIFAQSEIDQSPNTFYQFRFDKNQNASAVVGANLKRSTSTSAIVCIYIYYICVYYIIRKFISTCIY